MADHAEQFETNISMCVKSLRAHFFDTVLLSTVQILDRFVIWANASPCNMLSGKPPIVVVWICLTNCSMGPRGEQNA